MEGDGKPKADRCLHVPRINTCAGYAFGAPPDTLDAQCFDGFCFLTFALLFPGHTQTRHGQIRNCPVHGQATTL